jgi:hypothetical protein
MFIVQKLICHMERGMSKMLLRRFQGMLICLAGLLLMLLVTACSSVAGTSSGQTGNTGTTPTAAATSQTQLTPTATQAAAATPTQASTVAFKAGGISFIGAAKSVNSSSIVMSAPNGQTFTLKITPQTNLSGYGGSLPTVGSSVDMDSAANPDGSYSATILKPARAGDPDVNVIAYTGITTSAVGANRVIHMVAGLKSYTFTISPTANLADFGGNAQAIGNNASVKVKVQYNGSTTTVVSVGNPNGA